MSEAFYDLGGLRFWNEEEIELRTHIQELLISTVRRSLLGINSAWTIHQIEGPCLIPQDQINEGYTDKDVFVTNHKELRLRPETTASSYLYARRLHKRPLCIYQVGKSFRRELNDGASAAKMRYNEFWQLEFQCIYTNDTKAQYQIPLLTSVGREVARFTEAPIRTSNSDRLPKYSESTIDLEVLIAEDKWMEVASCSIRTDFSEQEKVCEMAIGLDRIVELSI